MYRYLRPARARWNFGGCTARQALGAGDSGRWRAPAAAPECSATSSPLQARVATRSTRDSRPAIRSRKPLAVLLIPSHLIHPCTLRCHCTTALELLFSPTPATTLQARPDRVADPLAARPRRRPPQPARPSLARRRLALRRAPVSSSHSPPPGAGATRQFACPAVDQRALPHRDPAGGRHPPRQKKIHRRRPGQHASKTSRRPASAGGAEGHPKTPFDMLLPKGGINWKAARASLPPSRAIWVFLTKTRFLLFVAVAGAVLLLWRGISTSASEMHKCAPPPRPPLPPPTPTRCRRRRRRCAETMPADAAL